MPCTATAAVTTRGGCDGEFFTSQTASRGAGHAEIVEKATSTSSSPVGAAPPCCRGAWGCSAGPGETGSMRIRADSLKGRRRVLGKCDAPLNSPFLVLLLSSLTSSVFSLTFSASCVGLELLSVLAVNVLGGVVLPSWKVGGADATLFTAALLPHSTSDKFGSLALR